MWRDCNPAARGTAPRAVLFDFNGVLVDDEHIHFEAFRRVLAPLGVRITRRLYDARYLAFDDRTGCAAALRDAGVPDRWRTRAAIVTLVARKRRHYRRLLGARRIVVGPGAARLVRALAPRLPLAVVSGAARAEVRGALRQARLLASFACIVAAENVRRSKPDPEGYRRALRLLLRTGRLDGAGGRGCVAIEDSPGGIRAARAAGLEVLGVATSYPPAALRRAGAYAVVASLARPTKALALLGLSGGGVRRRRG
jgi:HAD superfamily hydrolase (TIGR01509 family)